MTRLEGRSAMVNHSSNKTWVMLLEEDKQRRLKLLLGEQMWLLSVESMVALESGLRATLKTYLPVT